MAQAKGRRRKTADPASQLASEVIKRYASQQRIRIKLTPEQMEAILKQWNDKDPKMPAEITFHVGRKEVANLKVAGYRYRGDTCCI
jgi:hypothetical protein